MNLDTIAALATPAGTGALALLRVTGPAAAAVGRALLHTPRGGAWQPLDRQATPVRVIDPATGSVLDHAVATWFAGPRSYSGEDTLELCCHGNPLLATAVMTAICSHGARPAEPGEFTRRAWLHGKLDLVRVEALAALYSARSRTQLTAAMHQLAGFPSEALRSWRRRLLDLVADLEAAIDFPEDLADDPDPVATAARIGELICQLDAWRLQADRGLLLGGGFTAVIVGPPNAGKSSLLNALLGRDRALVTPTAGTTRDLLDETLHLPAGEMRLIDTAGLAPSECPIEQLGMARTRTALARADLALAVFDGSVPCDAGAAELIEAWQGRGSAVIWLANKSDLPRRFRFPGPIDAAALAISASTGAGLDELRRRLDVALQTAAGDQAAAITLGAGQLAALAAARAALVQADPRRLTLDLVLVHLREALDHLGGVTGEGSGTEIVDRIFERFCIGK